MPSLALNFDHCNCKQSRTGAGEGQSDTTSQRKQISHFVGWLQDLLRGCTDSCQLEPKRWRILTDLGPESFGWVCGTSWRSPTVALLEHCMWCDQRCTGDGEWGVSFPDPFQSDLGMRLYIPVNNELYHTYFLCHGLPLFHLCSYNPQRWKSSKKKKKKAGQAWNVGRRMRDQTSINYSQSVGELEQTI